MNYSYDFDCYTFYLYLNDLYLEGYKPLVINASLTNIPPTFDWLRFSFFEIVVIISWISSEGR